MRLFTIALALFTTLSAQERAGNQIFQMPQGWTRSDNQSVAILSPASEPPNYVAVILSGHPLTGDFRAAFDREVAGLNGTFKVVKSGEVQSRHTPQGIDLLATTAELQTAPLIRSPRYYLAASAHGRMEFLVYTAVNGRLFERYWPAVQQFMTTWSFAPPDSTAPPSPEATPPPPPPPASGATPANRLDGVYGGYKYIYANVLGAVQKKAVRDFFSFFPDGTVYWGMPENGLARFKMARACQGHIELCGTYSINGEHVTILVDRGRYRQDGTMAPGGLEVGDRNYKLEGDPAKSAAHMLEGDFMRADARPGEDLARRFIRFTRSGQFVDQGIITTVTSADITGQLRFEREAGSGTYALGPYTLMLRYSDGYQRDIVVTLDPADMDKPALSQIHVNTYTLVRRR